MLIACDSMSLLYLSETEGRLYQVAASTPSVVVASQNKNEKLDTEIGLQNQCLLYMYVCEREIQRESTYICVSASTLVPQSRSKNLGFSFSSALFEAGSFVAPHSVWQAGWCMGCRESLPLLLISP